MNDQALLYDPALMAGRPPTKDAPSFGLLLSTFRKARGWTQTQFAGRLGIPKHTLVYYERRSQNPSLEFAQKVADVFGVSVDELLGRNARPTGRKTGPPSQLESRIAAVRKLPRNRQKLVIELLDMVLRDATGSANGHQNGGESKK